MIKPEALLPRFQKLDEYLSILRRAQRYTREEFLNEPEHYGSAERFLQLAIEALNDIGNHIIADEGYGTVEWYSDIPKRLADHSVINRELEENWVRIIGFRNVLVHEYVELDRELVDRLKKIPADPTLIYGDYEELSGASKVLKLSYEGPEDITERAELGPLTIYRTETIKSIGGWDQSLKYAFDYDLRLKIGEMGGLHPISSVISRISVSRER